MSASEETQRKEKASNISLTSHQYETRFENEEAFQSLVDFLATDLASVKDKRHGFKKVPVKKIKFSDGQVSPVVEKIKKKYAHTACPHCQRVYNDFETSVLNGCGVTNHRSNNDHMCVRLLTEVEEQAIPRICVPSVKPLELRLDLFK
uniref:uncharacterized protein LOC120332632 n=1 Tax=Styela clava TaxID=7725 RepID=UPI001939E2D2|nr:uncharacterized protein LOC120332632 [Styela clava]